jgi:checkpoint serine/threonine-protein kinase
MEMEKLDAETEFLATKQETGNEWELFKENVRPLKRGRNVGLLNQALKSHTDYQLKKSLLDTRRSSSSSCSSILHPPFIIFITY